MKTLIILLVSLLSLSACSDPPNHHVSYEDCILANMKDLHIDEAVRLVKEACEAEEAERIKKN